MQTNLLFLETRTNLGISATFNSPTRDARNNPTQPTSTFPNTLQTEYKTYFAEVFADQTGTLNLLWSYDGSTFVTIATWAIVANTLLTLNTTVGFPFYRSQVVNGITAQTNFYLTSGFQIV